MSDCRRELAAELDSAEASGDVGRATQPVSSALGLFLVQLAFNGAWSWIFFGLNRMGLAFAELVALWLLILATMAAFFRVHRAAGWLLVPYLLWVT